ncbi:hypothetical protein N0V88_007379 [Collariella sp. IMI 366227]|nr:hypothetical protein N0V88_007379 [Collariella sp. IMI 366227]
MAWRCSGGSNRDLIENLWRNSLITHPQVKEAFLKSASNPPNLRSTARTTPLLPLRRLPQPIGHSATISAPHMHASAVEHLLPFLTPSSHPVRRILDIGSGSGYLTHVMAELAGPEGEVVGVEHIRGKGWKEGTEGDEGVEGLEEEKKWDAIHVGAAAVKMHEELLEQLKAPGRMFIPVDDDGEGWSQHIWCVDKDGEGKVSRRKLFGVRYVPLTDAPRK